MSEIERADWTDGGTDTPAPIPAKSQSISRPDWTDGPPVDVPAAVPAKSPSIARPDWTAPADDVPAPVEGMPDWPIEVDAPAEAPKYLVIDEPATPLDPGMVAELTASPAHDLGVAHGAVTAIQNAIPAADHAGFEAGFNGLSTETQRAIIGELALTDRAGDSDEYETWASDADLEQFATTPEGSELVSEWGSSADHRLGVIQARLLRMEDTADMSAAWAWFDALPPTSAKAVLKALAQ